jgi:hypothetical protein
MFPHVLKWSAPAVLAMVVLALPAPAAPVIKSGGPTLKLDKYLLDDADGVLVIDVKQIMASPAYKKNFQKQLAELVVGPAVQEYLKDIGFDPLKDVERVIFCMSKSCFTASRVIGESSDDGPFFLFQGKFDAAKVKAKMSDLVKTHPDKLTSTDAPGGQTIYRIDPKHGPFAAQLDGNTIVIAGRKAHVLDALAKAAGKKTTNFDHKDVPAQLKKFKPDVGIQGFALEQMMMSSSVSVKNDGMGKQVIESTYISLADKGFKEASLSISIKDDARGSVVWTVKDKDKVKPLTEMFTQGLDQIRKSAGQAAERRPQMQPLVRFLEGVTIKESGQTIRMEGKAEADMVQALFLGIFMGG